jgi:hypothetical protein
MIPFNSDRMISVNISTNTMNNHKFDPKKPLPAGAFSSAAYDGRYIWLTPINNIGVNRFDTHYYDVFN